MLRRVLLLAAQSLFITPGAPFASLWGLIFVRQQTLLYPFFFKKVIAPEISRLDILAKLLVNE
jgi:hypothetical protein